MNKILIVSLLTLTIATVNACESDAWNPETAYDVPNTSVCFDGYTWENQWYADIGEVPGLTNTWACQDCPDCVEWNAEAIYEYGNCVTYESEEWIAQYWTQNNIPAEEENGPWKLKEEETLLGNPVDAEEPSSSTSSSSTTSDSEAPICDHYDIHSCFAVDHERASTGWCTENCLVDGTTDQLHPGCNPESPAQDIVCQCGCWDVFCPHGIIESECTPINDQTEIDCTKKCQVNGGDMINPACDPLSGVTLLCECPCDDPIEVCEEIIFYEDCNYQGNSATIVEMTQTLDFQPKSFCLPEGKKLAMFNSCESGLQNAEYTESQACLPEPEISSEGTSGDEGEGDNLLKRNLQRKPVRGF